MTVKNYMEDAVRWMLDDVLKEFDVCKCEKCREDIVAIALNNLKPLYFSTHRGEVFVSTNVLVQQFRADIIAAIIKGIEKVKEKPNHNNNCI